MLLSKKNVARLSVILVSLGLSTIHVNAENVKIGVVTADSLNFRQKPVLENNILGEFSKGTELTIIDEQNDWYKVVTNNDIEGWVSSEYVELKVGIVITDNLNFRENPDLESNILTTLSKGTELTIIGEQNDWYNVKTSEGKVGWVSSQYINTKGNTVKTCIVATDNLNLRKNPDFENNILTTLSKGTELTIIDEQNNWYNVKTSEGKVGWVSSKYIIITGSTVSRGDIDRKLSLRQEIISYAKKFLGVSYVWGGSTPNGFDCSGFVKYVYAKFDVNLERVAANQAKQGQAVSKSELEPSDLVFFDTDGGHDYINHVGMYIGSGKFIQASSGKSSHSVVISDMSSGFYSNAFMKAKRFIK